MDQPKRSGFIIGIGREQFAIEPVRFAVVFPIAKNLRQFKLGITTGTVGQQDGVQQTNGLAVSLLLHVDSGQLDLQFFMVRKLDQPLLNERKRFLLIVFAKGLLALGDDLRDFLFGLLLRKEMRAHQSEQGRNNPDENGLRFHVFEPACLV